MWEWLSDIMLTLLLVRVATIFQFYESLIAGSFWDFKEESADSWIGR